MSSGISSGLYDVWGKSPADVFAVGDEGSILHYDGTSWSSMESSTKEHIMFIGDYSPTEIVAVTDKSTILIYDGTSWNTREKLPESLNLWGAWADSSSKIFMITLGHPLGDEYPFLYFNGTEYLRMKYNFEHHLDCIWGSSDTDVYAGGEYGTVAHFDGTEWRTLTTDNPTVIHAGWANSPSDVLAAGGAGIVMLYDGETWQTIETGLRNFWGIWGSIHSDIFAIQGDGVILHYSATQ
jgi:hypothetical protein